MLCQKVCHTELCQKDKLYRVMSKRLAILSNVKRLVVLNFVKKVCHIELYQKDKPYRVMPNRLAILSYVKKICNT